MGEGGVRSPPPPFPTIPPPSAARPPAPPPPGGSWEEGTPQVTQGAGFAREGFCTPKGAAKKKTPTNQQQKNPNRGGGGGQKGDAPHPHARLRLLRCWRHSQSVAAFAVAARWEQPRLGFVRGFCGVSG